MSDTEKNWLRNWLISVSGILFVQFVSFVWFLSAQAAEQRLMAKTIDRIEPEHNEIYFYYTQQIRRNQRP